MANSINADELKDIVAHGPIPRLLDVRRRTDLEAAPQKIEGASWYDPEKIDEWIDEIGRDEPVVVYCVRGGSVSQSVADRLEQKKVDARFINGGIMAWKEAEGPMEEPS